MLKIKRRFYSPLFLSLVLNIYQNLMLKYVPALRSLGEVVDPPGIEPGPAPCHGAVIPIYYGPYIDIYYLFL